MPKSRALDPAVAFERVFPIGLRRLASAKGLGVLKPQGPPAAEGVVAGERSSDPRAGRPKRRIISSFAATRAARSRSYGVRPCVRARGRKEASVGQRASPSARSVRRVSVERERKPVSVVKGNERKKKRRRASRARKCACAHHQVRRRPTSWCSRRRCAAARVRGRRVLVRAQFCARGSEHRAQTEYRKTQTKCSR
jgi:hypothetical protein